MTDARAFRGFRFPAEVIPSMASSLRVPRMSARALPRVHA